MVAPNKGKILVFCKECKRKRFCTKEHIPNSNYRYTCSKGHTWILEGFTLARMNAVMESVFSKEKIKNIFEREDTFFRALRK